MAYGKAGDWYINNIQGGGGSSDFSVKSLTIVNGDTNIIDVPLIPCFGDKTVYTQEGLAISPVELGNTLYTKDSSDTEGINVGESLTFNVLTYQNKVLLAKLVSQFKIIASNGCTVKEYYPKASEGDSVALITFTTDNATITVKYKL